MQHLRLPKPVGNRMLSDLIEEGSQTLHPFKGDLFLWDYESGPHGSSSHGCALGMALAAAVRGNPGHIKPVTYKQRIMALDLNSLWSSVVGGAQYTIQCVVTFNDSGAKSPHAIAEWLRESGRDISVPVLYMPEPLEEIPEPELVEAEKELVLV